MTDTKDLIREIQEHTAAHGGENTATHLLVQAALALQRQADEMAAIGAGGVSGPLMGGAALAAQAPRSDAAMSEWEKFEAWARPILGGGPTWSEGTICDMAWKAWRAATAAQAPQQAAPVDPHGIKAFAEYLAECEECSIVPDVAGAFNAGRNSVNAAVAAPQQAAPALDALFREALAWGMTYGPAIPAHQWDDMREAMVSQYVGRAAQAPQPAITPETGNPATVEGAAITSESAAPQQAAPEAVQKAISAMYDVLSEPDRDLQHRPHRAKALRAAIDALESLAAPQQAAPASIAGPMEFGGCPECGSRNCVARQCSRTVSHAAQAIPGVNWQDNKAAPQQAAPANPDDAKDAARWRWLGEHIQAAWDEGKFTSLVRIVSDSNRAALNTSIDRMMAGNWSDADRAAPQQAAPAGWWRKRAYEIEAQVAMTGSPEAMRCFTDMRTLLQAATEAAPQQEVQSVDDLAKELDTVREALQWYMRRCEQLQHVQHRMRDPERTMVCDILANGSLLVPEGQRYTAQHAPSGDAWKDGDTAALVNQLRDVAVQCRDTQQLRERIAQIVRPLAERVAPSRGALDLLEEVAACFTRDDDLPNGLLPRIDAMPRARKEGK